MKTLSSVTKDLKINSRACLTGLLLSFTALPVMAGSIVGSAHDFSAEGWNSSKEICITCHTPHNAGGATEGPLWNHTLSAETAYGVYASTTLDAGAMSQPTGSSKLCLSCHDGTIAVDSFGGAAGTDATKMTGDFAVGADGLANDHPISFTYDDALATADGALHAPSTTDVTIGSGTDTKDGTIASVMLIAGELQCATCHDVHNKFAGTTKLLRVDNAGSALCLTCHAK